MLSVEDLIAEAEPTPATSSRSPETSASRTATTGSTDDATTGRLRPAPPPGLLKVICREALLSGEDLDVIERLYRTLADREPRRDEVAHLVSGFADGSITRRHLFDKLVQDGGCRWVALAGKGWLMDGEADWFSIRRLASLAIRCAWARMAATTRPSSR